MTKIKCAECGKEDEVPFKPRDGSTVLCKECYFKKKGIAPRTEAKEQPKEEKASEEAEEADIAEEGEESAAEGSESSAAEPEEEF
jgi:CxxC-x17-CxxC domain-containing protein